jgi:hypothetical protein
LLFKNYSNAISLHKDIQTTVVDIVYLGDKAYLSKFLNTGRISIDEAMKRVADISEAYNIDALLSQLED